MIWAFGNDGCNSTNAHSSEGRLDPARREDQGRVQESSLRPPGVDSARGQRVSAPQIQTIIIISTIIVVKPQIACSSSSSVAPRWTPLISRFSGGVGPRPNSCRLCNSLGGRGKGPQPSRLKAPLTAIGAFRGVRPQRAFGGDVQAVGSSSGEGPRSRS